MFALLFALIPALLFTLVLIWLGLFAIRHIVWLIMLAVICFGLVVACSDWIHKAMTTPHL
jgi:hypothetical protein